ncbi:Hemolysin, contains CBS domains [Desulfomicrobium apsheronum]|uniref:Hemolysin, contains CBS domains n=1 Tax=Desulfomicrobium apsheronum TaxID=52560 RepID=A0A1I3R5N5_9BACT|nr:hemolysin family protein [Desulfomicrobium apsheronum]SFJ41913.1 Hemolysin, contains CBS domains [Desulfomicrobium apsheronum]
MSADLLLLFIVVFLALGFSFLCSVAEAVLLSITPSYIASLREKNPARADVLTRLRLDKVDQSLSAILTLNTIAHTVGAIVAGAQALVVFGNAWIGLFSAVMTLLILFLSEIVPKTIGAIYWQSLTGMTAYFVGALIRILFPLVWLSNGLTRLISRGKREHVFSRDEFIAMAGIGEQSGHLEEHESRIIRNIFRFGSVAITAVMTPRTVMTALQQDMSIADSLPFVTKTPFSRLPVYGADLDDITGLVLKDEVLICMSKGRCDGALESLKRPILSVPDSLSLSDLLEFFLDKRQHLAIVLDEYGGTRGVVTLEDVVETLFGMEIVDEMDSVADMQALARQQWEKRARSLGIFEQEQNREIESEKNIRP